MSGLPANVETCRVFEVLARGQLVVEHRSVAHVADAATRCVWSVAQHRDPAQRRPQQPGEHAQQRGLARAVLTQQQIAAAAF